MRRVLFSTVVAVLVVGLFIGIVGCGEDEQEKEPAKMLKTEPVSGGEISANGSLLITFDIKVTDVKVNGTPAEVAGTKATWRAQDLQAGGQTLKIEWVDENGNTGSEDITLTITAIDTVPPQVGQVSVEDGAIDVDPDKLNADGIVISFSERIDANKSKGAFALFEGEIQMACTPEWKDDNTQVILRPGPQPKLRPGSEYTLTISGYFDGAGNEGSALEIAFATAGVNVPTESLMLWLKADEGVTLSGNSVSEWSDQSGNGTDAEQAKAANQPSLEEKAINGLPALSFDGTDDFMTFTLPIDGLTGMTIFIVSSATEDIEPPWPFCANAAIFWNETASWGTAHVTPLQKGVWIRFGTGQTQPLPVFYEYESPIGDRFTIATAMMDGVMDYLYVNGELVLENEKPAGQEALGHQRDVGNIGRGYNDNTYFPGMIAEVLVYTEKLSDAEREQVEGYLSSKYLIQ